MLIKDHLRLKEIQNNHLSSSFATQSLPRIIIRLSRTAIIVPSQDCPEGSYCDIAETNPLDQITGTCLKGRYCPVNTEHKHQYKCPKGTFNDQTGQTNVTDCKECTPGMFHSNQHLRIIFSSNSMSSVRVIDETFSHFITLMTSSGLSFVLRPRLGILTISQLSHDHELS